LTSFPKIEKKERIKKVEETAKIRGE